MKAAHDDNVPEAERGLGASNDLWDGLRNLKTIELAVRDDLNGLEREWVIGRLVSQGGVRDALYQEAQRIADAAPK